MSHQSSDPDEFSPLEKKIGVLKDWIHKKVTLLTGQNDGQAFAGWKKRLTSLLEDARRKPEVPIALVGSTGSGKSTLLNALLGVEVLPVSNMKPCTAVVTSVRHSAAPAFQATVTFLSRQAWDEELQKLKDTFRPGDGGEDPEGEDEWQVITRSTRDKICAVYDLDKEAVETMPDLDALKLDSKIAGYLEGDGKRISLEASSAKELKQQLRDYLDSEERFWPLIKTVEICGPFDALRHGAVLIDLPGVNDPNQAREEVTRAFLRDAPFIWIAFNTKRGMTRDIHQLLVKQDLLRQFLMHGKHDAVTFIGTHADDFDPEQAIDEFNLESDATNAEIIRERNRRVIKQLRADLEDISTELAHLAKASYDDLKRLKSTLDQTKAFVVSTRAYMKLQKISQGRKDYGIENIVDSGVPAVLAHLSDVCRNQDLRAHRADIERRLGFISDEIKGFFLARVGQIELQQGALRQKADNLKARLDQPRKDLAAETDRVTEKAKDRFTTRREAFESSIKLATDRARRGLEERFDRWSGMHHMTLRACMVREGEFLSSTGKHHDFNKDIALPLLESIPFTWDDFFGQHLRESLTEVREKLKARGEIFLERLKSEASQSGVFDAARITSLSSDIELSQRNIEFHVEEKVTGILRTIQRIRTDLAEGITDTVRKFMLPAYAAAKDESGIGMKRRMLDTIMARARQAGDKLFDTIQTGLTEGVVELGLQFNHNLDELADIVGQQADRVSNNLGLGAVQHQAQSVESTRQTLDGLLAELSELVAPAAMTLPIQTIEPETMPKPASRLIYDLPSIRSDLAGFTALAELAATALADKATQLEVNMSRTEVFDANMAAPLGVVLNKLTDALKAVTIVAIPTPIEAILHRNGFLTAFNYPRVTDLSPTALPYQRFKLADTNAFADYLYSYLPGKGLPNMDSELALVFQQSLFEIFNNSAIHSESKPGVFACGQFFRLKHRLDISIADAGVGIPNKVNQAYQTALQNDRGFWDTLKKGGLLDERQNMKPKFALEVALAERSTTKTGRLPGGLGLKLIKRFVGLNGGCIQIASGRAFWEFSARSGDRFEELPRSFPGTTINLEVDTDDNKSYSLALMEAGT